MKKNKMTVLFVTITVVISLGIFFGLLWNSFFKKAPSNLIVLPSDDAETIADNNLALLSKVEISKTNFQQVIASMSRPANVTYLVSSTITYDSNTASTYQTQVWNKDGYSKMMQTNTKSNTIRYSVTGENKYFTWAEGSNTLLYAGPLGDFTADDMQLIPTYESLALIDPNDVMDVETWINEDQNCIFIRTLEPTLDYINEYKISMENGLLTSFETMKRDQTKVFEMQLTSVNIGTVDDTMFVLPDGTDCRSVEVR